MVFQTDQLEVPFITITIFCKYNTLICIFPNRKLVKLINHYFHHGYRDLTGEVLPRFLIALMLTFLECWLYPGYESMEGHNVCSHWLDLYVVCLSMFQVTLIRCSKGTKWQLTHSHTRILIELEFPRQFTMGLVWLFELYFTTHSHILNISFKRLLEPAWISVLWRSEGSLVSSGNLFPCEGMCHVRYDELYIQWNNRPV